MTPVAARSTHTEKAQAYYTTSYAFGNSTTSTIALVVWKLLSDHLVEHEVPLTAQQLGDATGLSFELIEAMFSQQYYQRFYGFRRFESLKAWRTWAEQTGLVYVPGLHDAPAEDASENELDEEADEATE